MIESDRDPGLPTSCSRCSSSDLHVRRLTSAGGHGPYFLQGLGELFHYAHFDVVVCANCGLTQLFAEPSARDQLPHEDWKCLRR